MTLEAIMALPGEVLTCKQVAAVLGMSETNLHAQAIERPDALGFPVIVAGRRVKVPKRMFVKFMGGEQ